MKNKKKTILLVISVILLMILIIFLVGRSFGFFQYIKKGENINLITISGIETKILSTDDNVLNLENAYPISDSDGLSLTPFVFSMTNTSSRNLSYTMKIEMDTDKLNNCTLEDGSSCQALSTNAIKYSYKKDDGTYSTPKNLGASNDIITGGVISSKETITSSIILWIDSEAGNEYMNQYFFGKLMITGEEYITRNFKEAILSDNKLITAEPTLTTSSNNTSDASGLYASTATNTGDATYYFRGNVENNYVKFAGFTWRIVRINEDGTIRLIMQDGINSNTNITFNSNYNNYTYMYYTNSQAKTTLESWYQTNIGSKADLAKNVASGNYYCEQAKAKRDSSWTSGNATMTTYSKYTPDFKCSSDGNNKGVVNASVGLLNYDEVVYAGGYVNQNNSNYYLYNSAIAWWTMSPAGFSSGYSCVWNVNTPGFINYNLVGNANRFRPVLIIKSDTIISGKGTSSNPYVVS